MNSVQIIGSKGSGGAENFYLRLCQSLQSEQHDVLAITPPACPLEASVRSLVSKQESVAMRGNWDIFSGRTIRKLISQSGAPIVQTWMGRATRLTDVRSLKGVTHVARLGGYYNLKAYRHADAWVGNTRGICEYLVAEGLPASRVFHISNFYQVADRVEDDLLQKRRDELGLEEDALILFSLGRLHINKGFDILLEAFSQVVTSEISRPVYLLIAGDGPLRDDLHQQMRLLGLEQQVKWLGWQTDTAEWFQLADIFICPSRHEPLGNVILEAWGNGVPVIASNIQGPAELIEQGMNGLLIPNEDAAALAGQIMELSRDSRLAASLAEQARSTLENKFSVQGITGQYLALYDELCSTG